MKKLFLTAEWRKLILVNYAIDPEILKKYLPFKTELDLWEGKCYVSLVGFMFLNKKAPSKLAKPWLTGIAWRLVGFISFISGKDPAITKESVSTSHFINQYNSDKLKQAIDFKFTPIKEACKNTGAFYLKRK